MPVELPRNGHHDTSVHASIPLTIINSQAPPRFSRSQHGRKPVVVRSNPTNYGYQWHLNAAAEGTLPSVAAGRIPGPGGAVITRVPGFGEFCDRARARRNQHTQGNRSPVCTTRTPLASECRAHRDAITHRTQSCAGGPRKAVRPSWSRRRSRCCSCCCRRSAPFARGRWPARRSPGSCDPTG